MTSTIAAASEERPTCGQKCGAFWAHSSKYIFVILAILGYSCLGGKIFQILEEGTEEENCWRDKEKETRVRVKALKSIWESWIKEENMTALVYLWDDSLKAYRDDVMKIGGDFTSEDCLISSWTWANAVLFSVTIISTIGYGHISPGTWEGQIVCICYAVVGLPIFGVFLSLLGDLLAEWFLNGYRKFSSKFFGSDCCRSPEVKNVDDDDRTLPPSSAGFTTPDLKSPFSPQVKPRDPEHVAQRVGSDDSAASSITLHQIWPLGNEGGDAPKPLHYYDNPKHFARMDTFESFRSGSSFYERTDLKHEDNPVFEAVVVAKFEPDGEHVEEEESEVVTVPLTVSVSLMASYLGLGAVVFSTFEGWSAMEGAYFSFITLSTIGFGDFVPGEEVEAIGAELKMICASVYIMFGMALLAMCFNLMQEKVVRKLGWIIERCRRTKEE